MKVLDEVSQFIRIHSLQEPCSLVDVRILEYIFENVPAYGNLGLDLLQDSFPCAVGERPVVIADGSGQEGHHRHTIVSFRHPLEVVVENYFEVTSAMFEVILPCVARYPGDILPFGSFVCRLL